MPINPKTGKHLAYTKENIAKAKKKGWPMRGKGGKGGKSDKKGSGLAGLIKKGY